MGGKSRCWPTLRRTHRQSFGKNQLHGLIDWNSNHAVLAIDPSVRIQDVLLGSFVLLDVQTWRGLQEGRLRRNRPRISER